jgi:hypothetical protein
MLEIRSAVKAIQIIGQTLSNCSRVRASCS